MGEGEGGRGVKCGTDGLRLCLFIFITGNKINACKGEEEGEKRCVERRRGGACPLSEML